ncbi:unnamed protein product [Brachionus calyciflorus]|uniref:Uncharacterized protein n=1 Tax=Brachionus calyciflorus TaxID=104777 RepID=A0A814EL13_9BILA|nr:unnamed protein product [Brachionus calyciflorus]
MVNLFHKRFKSYLMATLKLADVQRHLRSELKNFKISLNFEHDVMKFLAIVIKIENMPEFELVWFFLEALNPGVRAELESKIEETLNEAIRLARVYTRGLGSFALPTVVNYTRQRTDKRYPKNGNLPRYKSVHGNMNKNQPKVRDKEFKNGDLDKCKMEYVYTCNSSNLLCVSGFKYCLNLNDSRIKIKTANNSISKVDRKTDSLKVDIDGHVCDLEFLLIDHEDNDGLLGLDWFMRTGASLHPKMKNCNKVVTEILSDEVFPIDTTEDFDIAEEDWPLESGLSKIEIKSVEELKGDDYRHFKEALDSIKDRFSKNIKEQGR